LVTDKIIREGLKYEAYKFVLNGVDLRDKDAEIKRQQMLFSIGAITSNQIRQSKGEEPYGSEGDQYHVASTYVPIGEEAVEKREGAMIAELEGLKSKVDEVLGKK
jgi:hypothetical protein